MKENSNNPLLDVIYFEGSSKEQLARMKETIVLGKLNTPLPQYIGRQCYKGVTRFFDIYDIEYVEDIEELKEEGSTHLTARRLVSHEPELHQRIKLEELINAVRSWELCSYTQSTISLIDYLKKSYNEFKRLNYLECELLNRALSKEEKKEYERLSCLEFDGEQAIQEFWNGIKEIREESNALKKRKVQISWSQRDEARLIEEMKRLEELSGETIDDEERNFLVSLL